MDYNDIAKIVNKYIMILNGTIMLISINILGYSFTNYKGYKYFDFLFLIYISWFCLITSFFIGIIRAHHLIKVLTRNAAEQFDIDVKGAKIQVDEKRVRLTNKISAQLYRIMMISFCLGIIIYGLFLIINL